MLVWAQNHLHGSMRTNITPCQFIVSQIPQCKRERHLRTALACEDRDGHLSAALAHWTDVWYEVNALAQLEPKGVIKMQVWHIYTNKSMRAAKYSTAVLFVCLLIRVATTAKGKGSRTSHVPNPLHIICPGPSLASPHHDSMVGLLPRANSTAVFMKSCDGSTWDGRLGMCKKRVLTCEGGFKRIPSSNLFLIDIRYSVAHIVHLV